MGKIVILEIDVQGGMQSEEALSGRHLVFILPPTEKDLASRMHGRGRGEDRKTTKMRLETAAGEIAAARQYYEHMVIDAVLEQAIREVNDIIQSKTGETQ